MQVVIPPWRMQSMADEAGAAASSGIKDMAHVLDELIHYHKENEKTAPPLRRLVPRPPTSRPPLSALIAAQRLATKTGVKQEEDLDTEPEVCDVAENEDEDDEKVEEFFANFFANKRRRL